MTTWDGLRRDYGAILADPPWRFATRSPKGRDRCPDGKVGGKPRHYRTMDLASIICLPVWELAARDCALFLWVTDAMLLDGLNVMSKWGFEYKTVAFTWVKASKHDPSARPIGTGYWTRANPEMCLLGTRGAPRRQDRSVRQMIEAPRLRHSEKPGEVRTRIERLVPGPYVELFARQRCDGWAAWGDEA